MLDEHYILNYIILLVNHVLHLFNLHLEDFMIQHDD